MIEQGLTAFRNNNCNGCYHLFGLADGNMCSNFLIDDKGFPRPGEHCFYRNLAALREKELKHKNANARRAI